MIAKIARETLRHAWLGAFALLMVALFSPRAHALVFDPVTVDPSGDDLNSNFSANFNVDGNFQGWTTANVSGAQVTGGALTGVSSPSDPQIQITNIASGVDLDLGFNDYLDLRIQVPANYLGDIRVYYGTATLGTVGAESGTPGTPGIVTTRFITIPAAKIPKDGAFHTYRYDLGLEILWRGYLHDLRIDPLIDASGNGQSFAVAYLHVGDIPNDVYLPNYTNNTNPADQAQTTYSLESKHFRFIWNATRATTSYANGLPVVDANWAHGNLRNAEDIWSLKKKFYGYIEPSQSTNPAFVDGNKYKVNLLCTYDGYWEGVGAHGFGYDNIDPTGWRVNPPTWALPHEETHVFQTHSQWPGTDQMPGEYHEMHANYGREQWIYYFESLPGWTDLFSGIDAEYINNQNLIMAHGRDYYLCWPWFLYLDENPDHLADLTVGPTAPSFVAQIWQTHPSPTVSPYVTIQNLAPHVSVQDLVGYYARRMATFDFAHRTDIVTALNTQTPAVWNRMHVTELVHSADRPGWWRVPNEIAPQQGAFAVHQLDVPGSGAGRVVSVNLQGMPDAARGAGWRAALVAVDNSGSARYTPLWANGVSSITLSATETTLYLTVAATPTNFPYVNILPDTAELTNPYRTDPGKQRFPYEVQVTGATPHESNNGSTAGLIQHANGGGYQSTTAQVDASAYIGPNARVLGAAQVRGNARIEDYAVIQGGSNTGNSPLITGNAVVGGHALVQNQATIQDNAKVRDWAIVTGNGTLISGNAIVAQHGRIWSATVDIQDDAMLKGCAIMQGATPTSTLSGDAIMDGDTMGGRTITSGIAFGHLPYTGIPDNWIRPTPDRITASYPFDLPRQSVAVDGYGGLEAYLRGGPTWVSADAKRTGFYVFDGTDQWMLMERLVADTKAFTFTAWVKPLGGSGNQALLWVGATPTQRMAITPDDGSGHAKFSISDGVTEQTLVAPTALAINQWSHIAVTLSNPTGVLYVNGAAVTTGTVTLTPDQVLPADTGAADAHCYLARSQGATTPMLHGAIDDVQFYRRALSAGEIAAMNPAPSTETPEQNAGTVYVDLRASDPTAGAATWHNHGTLGDFSRVGAPSLTANVSGTGNPGVLFNGTADAYQGPNSVADIDGAGDRSIEVWAYNPALVAEETMVSWGHRGSTRQDMAFNFGNNGTWGAATHWGDDVAWGTPPTANAWHHLVYTYSGVTVKVYIDGALSNTRTLSGNLNTFASEQINIACQRDTANGNRSLLYGGYIHTVRVEGGVLSDAQVLANFQAGLPTFSNASAAPTISAIGGQTVAAGTPVGPLAFTIGDADTPLAALTVAATSSNPALVNSGAITITGTGASRAISLSPAPQQTGQATITVSVSDGATVVSQNFTVTFQVPNEVRDWTRWQ